MSLLPFFLEYDPYHLSLYYNHRHKVSPWERLRLLLNIKSQIAKEKKHGPELPRVIVDKNGYQVFVNVKQFKPDEVKVKIVDDFIVVEGNHEEREDEHGNISRHFVRKFKLPKEFDSNEIISTLSSDGILMVKAPHLPANAIENPEKIIQVHNTGLPHSDENVKITIN